LTDESFADTDNQAQNDEQQEQRS